MTSELVFQPLATQRKGQAGEGSPRSFQILGEQHESKPMGARFPQFIRKNTSVPFPVLTLKVLAQ